MLQVSSAIAFAKDAVEVPLLPHTSSKPSAASAAGISWQWRTISITFWAAMMFPALVAATGFYSWRAAKLDVAHMLLCLVIVALNLNNSIVIVEAYRLASAVGMSAAWSGFIVGAIALGAVSGSTAGWAVMRFCVCWKRHVKMYLLIGLLIAAAGVALYAAVSMAAAADATWVGGLPTWVVVARVLAGLGGGLLGHVVRTLVTVITPPEEQVLRSSRQQIARFLGSGLGPFMVSLLGFADPGRGRPPDYLVTGPIIVVLVVLIIVVVAAFFPSIEAEVSAGLQVKTGQKTADGQWQREDRWVVANSLVGSFMRNTAMRGLGAASSLMLERSYGWPHTAMGTVGGACYMLMVPAGMIKEQVRGVSLATFTWALTLVTTFGCCFLFQFGDSPEVGATTLILGEVVLFPLLSLGDATIIGYRNRHLGPPGTLFDAVNTNLYHSFCLNAGLVFSPWLARWSIEISSRNVYATLQSLLVLIINVLTQVWLVPRVVE